MTRTPARKLPHPHPHLTCLFPLQLHSHPIKLTDVVILGGEVERPCHTSIKTLSILRDLDESTAALFKTLCSASVHLAPVENVFSDARVSSLGSNAGNNSLLQYGLGFADLNVLNEHGLIISDYNSYYDYHMSNRESPCPVLGKNCPE